MKYVVWDLQTGNILRTGICPDTMLEIQAQPGEGVLSGEANERLHYILDQKIAEKTKEMLDADAEILAQREIEFQKERMILQRMDEILRKQAIKELKDEGKL